MAALQGDDGLAAAYAHILDEMCQSWIYNCDSGCFADTCERQVFEHGDYKCIYQPHKSMLEYEDFVASVFIKKTTGTKKISAKDFKAFNADARKRIEADLLASYNDYLESSGGKWLSPKVDGTFGSVMQIRKPLELQSDGGLKMSFEIRGATVGCCGDSWTPWRLERNWRVSTENPEYFTTAVGNYETASWREYHLKYDAVKAAI